MNSRDGCPSAPRSRTAFGGDLVSGGVTSRTHCRHVGRSFARHVHGVEASKSICRIAFFSHVSAARHAALFEAASTSRNEMKVFHDRLDAQNLRSDFRAISHEPLRSTRENRCALRSYNGRAFGTARLFRDMFPFIRQVRAATDHAINATARLAGAEPSEFGNTKRALRNSVRDGARQARLHGNTGIAVANQTALANETSAHEGVPPRRVPIQDGMPPITETAWSAAPTTWPGMASVVETRDG